MSDKIKLSDGTTATFEAFKGKHVIEAQKIVGQNQEMYMIAMLAQCVLIDGKKKVFEDYQEMNGADVLKLLGEFGTNFL